MLQEIYQDTRERMLKAIEATQRDFSTLRTGRASVGILDNVRVNYYGVATPLNQVGTVTVPDAQTLSVQPWEPAMIPEVEKAILGANLGITPNNDGSVIRMSVPPLTEERRKELAKQVKKYAEDGRVAVRNIRRSSNEMIKDLEKEKEISEDESKKAQDEIQKITDTHIQQIDDLAKHKESELMKV